MNHRFEPKVSIVQHQRHYCEISSIAQQQQQQVQQANSIVQRLNTKTSKHRIITTTTTAHTTRGCARLVRVCAGECKQSMLLLLLLPSPTFSLSRFVDLLNRSQSVTYQIVLRTHELSNIVFILYIMRICLSAFACASQCFRFRPNLTRTTKDTWW